MPRKARRDRRAANEVQQLVNDLGKIPPELKKQLRPAIRKAGRPVLQKAKANASFSTRIPAATRMSIRMAGKRAGVRVETNRLRAPHARPIENRGRDGFFRHPVFGNRENWVNQRAEPYLWPAVRDSASQVARDIDDAVMKVARDAGFR